MSQVSATVRGQCIPTGCAIWFGPLAARFFLTQVGSNRPRWPGVKHGKGEIPIEWPPDGRAEFPCLSGPADVASRIEAIQNFLPPPSNQTQGATVTSSIESFDKAIISRQPNNFNDRKSAKVIPNLKTLVVHCVDPRVTGGIPTAVAKALPGQIYPGEVFEFVGEGGKNNMGSNTTIFPVVVAGGRASASAQLSISIACHLFDIDLTRHTGACKCLWLSVRHRNWRTASR